MEKFKFIYEKYKVYIFIFIVFFVCLFSEIGGFWFYNKYIVNKISTIKNNSDDIKKEEENEYVEKNIITGNENVFVDIKGEVINPGVYSVKVGSRIIDVINMAGGLTDNADTSVNNMSKILSDEMVIIIYSKDEVLNYKKIKEEENKVIEKCNNNDKNIVNDSCYDVDDSIKADSNKLTNINEASVEELMLVKGIGKSKAEGIVEYRNKNGKFDKIEDIMNVSGIGESLFEKIKEYICI